MLFHLPVCYVHTSTYRKTSKKQISKQTNRQEKFCIISLSLPLSCHVLIISWSPLPQRPLFRFRLCSRLLRYLVIMVRLGVRSRRGDVRSGLLLGRTAGLAGLAGSLVAGCWVLSVLSCPVMSIHPSVGRWP